MKGPFQTLFVAVQLTFALSQFTQSIQSPLKTILQNYDPTVRPREDSGHPVQVATNMYLRSFEAMDNDLNVLETQITFRMQWNDSRLAHNSRNPFSSYLTIQDDKILWTPDIFFSNSKSGFRHNVLKPNVLLRVNPSGEVLYSTRLTLQLKCLSDPEMYPLDKVTCPIIFASYGLTTRDERFEWKSQDPVQIGRQSIRGMVNFDLERFETDSCNARTKTGEFSCLRVNLFFHRKPFRTYFFYLYLPSLGLVVLSWLTFFINRKASEIVRLSLTLTFTLLMALICTSLWNLRPHYGYITPVDIWVFVSAIFVFYAMMHYVGTSFLPCLSCCCSKPDDEGEEKMKEPFMQGDEKRPKPLNHSERLHHLFQRNKADMVARVLYPICYILFVIIYSATQGRKEESS